MREAPRDERVLVVVAMVGAGPGMAAPASEGDWLVFTWPPAHIIIVTPTTVLIHADTLSSSHDIQPTTQHLI